MLEQDLEHTFATDPRSVMIIVGAGVTIGALQGTEHRARASWAGLIRDGLEYAVALHTLDREDAQRLEGLLQSSRTGLWISAAEQLTEALGGPSGGDFKAWLRRSVGSFATAIRDRSVLDVLADLERIGVTIATVNYDSMLEEATGQRAVTWRQASEVERVLRGDARGILHLHGHWEDSTSIVLGTTSYGDVVRDPHARAVLESMRMFRTLIFVGHGAGLRDPNWGTFLDWTARVFAGAEYRHYRIAREAEIPALLTPELQAQRIFLVGYKGGYENLGPFLRGLVPQHATAAQPVPAANSRTEPEPELHHVLLLVNIGERHYSFVSREDVETHGGVPKIDEVLELPKRVLDLKLASAAQWREIAADLDGLVERAVAAARAARGKVCFVIAGVAPSPVFVYLGIQSRRLVGKVLLVNRNTTGGWDRIGPYGGATDFPCDLREVFTLDEPTVLRDPSGRMELFVACSSGYKYSPELLQPVTSGRGQPLNGAYRITAGVDKGAQPLDAGDLRGLTKLANAAVASRPTSGDFVLAFGGPMWAAFWLGRELTATVAGYVEIPNFVPGAGYVPALASPMWRQLWVPGLPRTLALTAEPDDEARTRASAQLAAIEQGLTGALGRDVMRQVRFVHSTKVDQILGLLDEQCPHILHVYAHGAPDGSLGFEDERGDTKTIRPERFLEVLRATEVRLVLTLMVACYSAELAEGLRELSDCVIIVHGNVGYAHAEKFARAFYRALGEGCSVGQAFTRGVAQAGALLDPSTQPFELKHRSDIDPAAVFLWPRTLQQAR